MPPRESRCISDRTPLPRPRFPEGVGGERPPVSHLLLITLSTPAPPLEGAPWGHLPGIFLQPCRQIAARPAPMRESRASLLPGRFMAHKLVSRNPGGQGGQDLSRVTLGLRCCRLHSASPRPPGPATEKS